MNGEGHPVPVKKCFECCLGRPCAREDSSYQICAYCTCGSAGLLTFAILASAGVIG